MPYPAATVTSLAVALAVWTVVVSEVSASERVHLLGFVERMCPAEPYCFDLAVKPEYQEPVGARLRVRFGDTEQIYDPENYLLTLAQQKIGPGSQLRVILDRDAKGGDNAYRAIVIWIGD